MTHTPGPWHLSERRDPHSGSPVYSVLAGAHLWLADVLGAECEAGEANARLIAAAPELLEACQAVVDNWERGDLAAAARMCSQAIAKAMGRSSDD